MKKLSKQHLREQRLCDRNVLGQHPTRAHKRVSNIRGLSTNSDNQRKFYSLKSGMATARAGMLVGLGISSFMWVNTLHAAGFAIIDHSASGMGNSFAGGAAVAEDASTLYFNPAGMTRLRGRQISGAGHLIMPSSEFSNEGSTTSAATGSQPLLGNEDDGGRNAFVPNFYYMQPINEQWQFGVGITAPFGLEITYDDDWVGRYHAVKSAVLTVNINPSVAVKINPQLSLGFGVNAQYIDVELSNVIDLGAVAGPGSQQQDGFVKFTGDSWDYGYNLGLLYEFSSTSRLGFHYRSSVEHSVKGDADFTVPASLAQLTQSGLFTDTGISAGIDLPDSISLSYFQDLNSKFAVMFDWTITKWSKFKELRIKHDNVNQPDGVTTEDWDDSDRISVGLNYKLDNILLLRFGLAYDQTPVPNAERRTPRLPGDNRTWVSFGFNVKPTKDISLDFGYAHLFLSDTDINNEFESSQAVLEHNLSGSYEGKVDIISAQLNWKF